MPPPFTVPLRVEVKVSTTPVSVPLMGSNCCRFCVPNKLLVTLKLIVSASPAAAVNANSPSKMPGKRKRASAEKTKRIFKSSVGSSESAACVNGQLR